MAKQDNTIFWIIGMVLLVAILSQVPFKFPFAIITKTTCVDNTISFWDFDGNVLDANNIGNGINHGTKIISGKLGQAVEFNTTTYVDFPASNANATIMWVKNYSAGDVNYYFLARLNGINYVNTVQSSSKKILNIGPNFGLGFNGSVEIMATFTDLSVSQMVDLYNNGSARNVCYTTSYEQNVTCKDYATEQVTDTGIGCLNYSGDFFPNCDYSWKTTSGFYISSGACQKRFYCKDILSSDFSSLTLCQEKLNETTTAPTTTAPTTMTPTETLRDKLNNEIFKVGGYSVKLFHLIILFVAVILILYLTRKNGKK